MKRNIGSLCLLLAFIVISINARVVFAQSNNIENVPGTKVSIGSAVKELYDRKCGRCHVAFEPGEFSAEDWPGLVRIMKEKASLTENGLKEIVGYLVSNSKENGNQLESFIGRQVVSGYSYTEYFKSEEKAKNFDLHYLALGLSGWAADNIYYYAEFELEHGGIGANNTFVEEAYIDYWVKDNVAIKIGAMLTPFNRFDEFHAPLNNYLITRPQVSREIGVSAWKDVGVDFHGYFNLNEKSSFSFDLYGINGLGDGSNLRGSRQYRDNNEDVALGGRVNVKYNDFLEIGSSFYSGAWDDAGDYNLTLFGGYFMARTRAADFYGEFARASSENPAPAEKGDMLGYFVQASRMINSNYRATIRYGALDYLDVGNALGRNSGKGDKDVKELALGFNFYPTQSVVLKTEYTIFMEGSRADKKDNNQFGLQIAFRW